MKLKCYKCNTVLKNQEDLSRISQKYNIFVFQCSDCTEKEIKKSEENSMIIKFKKGIDENGVNYCKMKFDILPEVSERFKYNVSIDEDGYTDCVSRNYERLVEYLYKVNISGYIINNTFTVRFGDQCKDFTFDDQKLSEGGLQKRVTAIKEWINSLPKEESWQIDLSI
jgi:uncharacterized C2H2 Zn-finger protein